MTMTNWHNINSGTIRTGVMGQVRRVSKTDFHLNQWLIYKNYVSYNFIRRSFASACVVVFARIVH